MGLWHHIKKHICFYQVSLICHIRFIFRLDTPNQSSRSIFALIIIIIDAGVRTFHIYVEQSRIAIAFPLLQIYILVLLNLNDIGGVLGQSRRNIRRCAIPFSSMPFPLIALESFVRPLRSLVLRFIQIRNSVLYITLE